MRLFPPRGALGLRGVSQLAITTTRSADATVVELAGELDLAGANVLQETLGRLEEGALVIDLRGVEFMDSSGLRVLAIAAQRTQERGRRFALVPGAAQVMRVFEITRMRERLEFVADPREVTGGL